MWPTFLIVKRNDREQPILCERAVLLACFSPQPCGRDSRFCLHSLDTLLFCFQFAVVSDYIKSGKVLVCQMNLKIVLVNANMCSWSCAAGAGKKTGLRDML